MKKLLKSWLLVGCAAGLALSLHSTANAQTNLNGIATVTVGTGDSAVKQSFAIVFDPQTGLYSLPSQEIDVNNTIVRFGSGGSFDPVLSYSFSATNNNVVATPFAFDAAIGIAPVHAGSTLISSLGFSLTDNGNPRDNVSESPFPIPPYLSGAFQTFTGDGIDLDPTASSVDIGTAETFTPTQPNGTRTHIYQFDGLGTSPIPFSTLDVHISFLLSPGGDNIGVTGSVEVIDVPEPGAVAMIAGLGISGSVFAFRRKRRA